MIANVGRLKLPLSLGPESNRNQVMVDNTRAPTHCLANLHDISSVQIHHRVGQTKQLYPCRIDYISHRDGTNNHQLNLDWRILVLDQELRRVCCLLQLCPILLMK